MSSTTDINRRRSEEAAKANLKMGAGMAKILMPLAIIAMIGALVILVFLFLAAFFKGMWMLMAALPLYPIVITLSTVAVVYIKRKARVRFLLSLLFGIIFCVLGCWGATAYYNSSSRIFPSMFYADHVQGGSETLKLYEKRRQKGNEIATLAAGEKVTVNGISFDYAEYNITTATGATGWITVAAFPEDAAEMLGTVIHFDGSTGKETAHDRQTGRLMEKYLATEKDVQKKLSAATLRQAISVHAQTPVVRLDGEAYEQDEKAAFIATGINMVLQNIVYADDCTLLQLSVANVQDATTAFRILNTAYRAPVVEDLDTGETWNIMQGKYNQTVSTENVRGGVNGTIVFIFPPFKSRHFSLTHTASPLPGKGNTGGGFLGWIASLVAMSDAPDYYSDWNFTEINVR
jgi:hypothetical protein